MELPEFNLAKKMATANKIYYVGCFFGASYPISLIIMSLGLVLYYWICKLMISKFSGSKNYYCEDISLFNLKMI